jgi:hypothetical protein
VDDFLLFLVLQVAATMVQLARLTLHKFAMAKNVNINDATYHLHRAKQLIDDSIRFFIFLCFPHFIVL